MRTLRNMSFLLLVCTLIAVQARPVRAIGCDWSGNAATNYWVSEDPGQWTCDNALDSFCGDCMCDYGVEDSGCDWGSQVNYDEEYEAYFVDFSMYCECMPDLL